MGKSKSWRITWPLSLAGKAVYRVMQNCFAWFTHMPMTHPRRIVKKMFIALKKNVNSHPLLKMVVLQILSWFPRLKTWLKNMNNPLQIGYIEMYEQLSPRARKVYHDLKAAIARNKGDY